MPEIKKEVKTYAINYHCDVCEELMSPTGSVFTLYPPLYEHTCKNGHLKDFRVNYPRIEHEEIS
jgi:hypothetical protein